MKRVHVVGECGTQDIRREGWEGNERLYNWSREALLYGCGYSPSKAFPSNVWKNEIQGIKWGGGGGGGVTPYLVRMPQLSHLNRGLPEKKILHTSSYACSVYRRTKYTSYIHSINGKPWVRKQNENIARSMLWVERQTFAHCGCWSPSLSVAVAIYRRRHLMSSCHDWKPPPQLFQNHHRLKTN